MCKLTSQHLLGLIEIPTLFGKPHLVPPLPLNTRGSVACGLAWRPGRWIPGAGREQTSPLQPCSLVGVGGRRGGRAPSPFTLGLRSWQRVPQFHATGSSSPGGLCWRTSSEPAARSPAPRCRAACGAPLAARSSASWGARLVPGRWAWAPDSSGFSLCSEDAPALAQGLHAELWILLFLLMYHPPFLE